MTATSNQGFQESRKDKEWWGRLVESAVGAHLVNSSIGSSIEVFYWRDRGKEVDFVLRRGKRLVAIEVKSGLRRASLPGLSSFGKAYRSARKLLVGGDGIPLDEFFLTPIENWLQR